MTSPTRSPVLLAVMVISSLALSGCVTKRETFTGHKPDHVWTAMLAVANTPDYSQADYEHRWTVRENRVWVNRVSNRIEVYRRLERVLHPPAAPAVHQDREWKFQVMLEDQDPPTVRFTTRNLGVPSHAWDEAAHYFAEVWDVLGGKPANENEPSQQSQPATVPMMEIQPMPHSGD